MDRRTFLSWVGVGFVASSLPVAIAACTSNTSSSEEAAEPPPPPPGAIARDDGFLPIGPSEALETDGFLTGEADGTPVIVGKDTEGALVAIASTCSHAGCPVEWKSANSLFECNCHGSKFNSDGTVANGPATTALQAFDVEVEEDVVLVKPA